MRPGNQVTRIAHANLQTTMISPHVAGKAMLNMQSPLNR